MAASSSSARRILVKDLDVRIKELERKLTTVSEELARLDQRIQKIADSLTQQASRWN